MAYWKDHERRIAHLLGARRASRPWADAPDVEADRLIVECKARRQLPKWLVGALANAERHAGPEQLAIAVLHEKGKHSENDLVLLRLGQFIEWFGDKWDWPSDGTLPDPELP